MTEHTKAVMPLRAKLGYIDYLNGLLLNDRVLLINGEIAEFTAEEMTISLAALSMSSQEPITLLITSYGGAVDAGTAVIRAIRSAQSIGVQVIGEVRGYAMSMAALVLQACDVRFAAPEDVIMVHGFVGQHVGDVRNAEADTKMTKQLTVIYAKLLADRSTAVNVQYHSEKYWSRLLKDSLPHYYFGHEAYEIGLVDEVLLCDEKKK